MSIYNLIPELRKKYLNKYSLIAYRKARWHRTLHRDWMAIKIDAILPDSSNCKDNENFPLSRRIQFRLVHLYSVWNVMSRTHRNAELYQSSGSSAMQLRWALKLKMCEPSSNWWMHRYLHTYTYVSGKHKEVKLKLERKGLVLTSRRTLPLPLPTFSVL
jgi:hypothetical protein